MQLSLRLKKIAELVDKGSIVADIGCDHALLSIYLVKEGIACKVYAIDNKKEPLQSALNNISEYGLTKYITPCLQDGMSKLEKDVDVAVMAGIGGLLAIEILKKTSLIPKTLVIQANNHLEELRKYLCSNGFKIIDETILCDSGIYYEIIKVIKGKQELDYLDIIFGPCLRKDKTDIFYEKWNKMLEHYEFILSKHNENDDKLDKIKNIVNIIKKELVK